MPTHAPRPAVCIRWILATCLGACVGTPTPEPPDFLPRPDQTRIFGPRLMTVDNTAQPESIVSIAVVGNAGAVMPDSELWVVNLDNPGVAPITVRARVDGSFRGTLQGSPSDRVRMVTRTDTQHSLPLDARVVRVDASQVGLAQLPFEGLPCLTITPEDELTEVVSDGEQATRRFALQSRCDEPVALTAQLRFGDVGFTLEAPASVPADGEAAISVRISGHEDPREHADVVLLEVESGTRRGRYALGVWSIAASSLGNE